MNFQDKTILVTGATSGIGYGTAKKLIECGARVIALGRNQSRLDELVRSAPDLVTPITFDLLDFNRYRERVSKFPMLDGVVHSAGITRATPLRYLSIENYQSVTDTNLTAPTLLTAELLRAGCVSNGGSIVFVASINGTCIGMRGSAAYGASKAGLVAVSRVLALEVGHKSIRSNCVSPGIIETEMIENASELSQQDREVDRHRYPLGSRFGRVDEAVESICFLLSSNSSFITGQNLIIDGGYTAL